MYIKGSEMILRGCEDVFFFFSFWKGSNNGFSGRAMFSSVFAGAEDEVCLVCVCVRFWCKSVNVLSESGAVLISLVVYSTI